MNTTALLGLAADGNWSIGTFLQNSSKTLQSWGGYLVVLIGVVMMIVSVYMIAKGLITHGKGQPISWPVAIILLILGGAFSVSGWGLVTQFAQGGADTVSGLGTADASGTSWSINS